MNQVALQYEERQSAIRPRLPRPLAWNPTLVVRIWIIHSITLARLTCTVIFGCFVSSAAPISLLSSLLVFAMLSDALDGYLCRKFAAETYFGKVLDLVADKSLTLVCLLFAATRNVDIAPLCMIAVRDLLMIGMRLITVERNQIFPTNRVFGAAMAFTLWSSTILLLNARANSTLQVLNQVYWACAIIYMINLILRVRTSAHNIAVAATTPMQFGD
jgi:cardiolipin synthase (CMP-forming)